CRYLVLTCCEPAPAVRGLVDSLASPLRMAAKDLSIVDNERADRQALALLRSWCGSSRILEVASDFLEISGLLGLQDDWQQLEALHILLGAGTPLRHASAFAQAQQRILARLDESLEHEKEKNDFLAGVPALVEALRSGKIQCRLYRQDKLQA